jgi:hypothetical protein
MVTTRQRLLLLGGGLDITSRILSVDPSSRMAYWPFSDAVGTTTPNNSTPRSGNVAANGDFELFPYSGGSWALTASDGAAEDETTLIYDGAHALKLTAGASAMTRATTYGFSVNKVTPGKTYTLSFWTRGDGTNAGRYQLRDVTNAGVIIALTSTGIPGTTYTQYSTTFVAPAGCVDAAITFYCPAANGGIAYFDNAQIIAPATDNPYTATANNVIFGVPGIGDGKTACRFAGAGNSRIDIYSPAMRKGFNYSEFSVLFWYKYNADVLGVARDWICIKNYDDSNHVEIAQDVELTWPISSFVAYPGWAGDDGHIQYNINPNYQWACIVATCSISNARIRLFWNGQEYVGSPKVLAQTPNSIPTNAAYIGSFFDGASRLWTGDMAHVAIWNSELTPAQAAYLYVPSSQR